MISLGEILLVIVSLWGTCTWGYELIEDLIKGKNRGECIIAVDSRLNSYHFLGILYLVILMGFRSWKMGKIGTTIVTISFFCLSGICVYRAIRKQGLYTNGICIPEGNCSLEAIKAYKWVETELAGYTHLYLQVAYSNIFSKEGLKVIRWTVPDQKVPIINILLRQLENCQQE